MFGTGRGEQPVQRRRADRAQQFPLAGGELVVMAFVVPQPQGQGRRQPFAAGLLGGQPDRPHHRLDQPIARLGTGMLAATGCGQRVAQEFDGILALVTVILAQLVEPAGFAFAAAPLVARSQFGQQIRLYGLAHVHWPRLFPGSFIHEATTPFSAPQPKTFGAI